MYNNEKVYFKKKEYSKILSEDEYPQEVIDVLISKECEAEYEYQTDNYKIIKYDDDTIEVISNDKYALYKMPRYILEEYEKQNKLFNKMVGYNNWHVEGIYKPFEEKDGWMDYYKYDRDIKDFDTDNFTYITTVNSN